MGLTKVGVGWPSAGSSAGRGVSSPEMQVGEASIFSGGLTRVSPGSVEAVCVEAFSCAGLFPVNCGSGLVVCVGSSS